MFVIFIISSNTSSLSISLLLLLTWLVPIAAVLPLYFVFGKFRHLYCGDGAPLESPWHSGRLCSYFCSDLLTNTHTQDRQRIVVYLTTSYAGLPFLVMGVCYSLIYYQVKILLCNLIKKKIFASKED